MFNEIYKNKRVLVTGHTGFKGSWLTLWLKNLGAEVFGLSDVVAPKPSHYELLNHDMEECLGVDIYNFEELNNYIAKIKPDIVFHLAAQALVKDSYRDPLKTYQTNVMGSLNVLHSATTNNVKAFVNITTDKVYENREWLYPYRERDQLGGHDMYSSSKACSEIMSASYRKSFLKDKNHMLLASVRAGNVIGGGDWAKYRLIPDLVRNASQNKVTEIRSPKAIRPWQHVLEPLSGYLVVGQKLLEKNISIASSFNFGPYKELIINVEELIENCQQNWSDIKVELNPNDEFHEANILKLDWNKANVVLGWKPVWDRDKTLAMTINWYKSFYIDNKINTSSDLNEFVEDAKTKNLNWAV